MFVLKLAAATTFSSIPRQISDFHDANVIENDHFRVGSVMILAGVSFNTNTGAVVVNCNLNAARYQNNEILTPVAIPHFLYNCY